MTNDLFETIDQMMKAREIAIRTNHCVIEPMGCGKEIGPNEFRDALSAKEYTQSGMCQSCQDKFFGK